MGSCGIALPLPNSCISYPQEPVPLAKSGGGGGFPRASEVGSQNYCLLFPIPGASVGNMVDFVSGASLSAGCVCVQIGRHCQFIFLPVIRKDNIFGWLCSGITSGNQCSRDHMEIELGSAAKKASILPTL